MKTNLLFLLLLFTLVNNMQAQLGFSIKGSLENAEGLKIYLNTSGDALPTGSEMITLDSTIIRNKSFVMRGQVEEPKFYYIFIENKRGWKQLILENKTYQISGDADKIWDAKMEGSQEIQIRKEYTNLINPLIELRNAASDSSSLMHQIGDTARSIEFSELNRFYYKQMRVVDRDFILKYPDSYTSLFLFGELHVAFDKNEQKQVFEKLSDRIKKHSFAKKLYYELYQVDSLIDIGKPAIPFTLQDPYGNWINLSDYKGTYVLVDFWASRCGICRGEHPFLVELYRSYQPVGFEILSVSTDNNLENWVKAILDDELPWRNVMDYKGGINEVALKYGIKSLPTNFLLDKNGIIIARNLHLEDLQIKLLEIFR